MQPIVSDELGAVVAPLLPPARPHPRGGRPRLPDRAVVTGIFFILRTGIPWEWRPQELGCGSGMTCWRRRRDWHQAGVWRRWHRVLAVPPIHRPRGRPRRRPAKLHGDKAYDYARCHAALRARRILDRLARRGIESSERLGRVRWVVARTLAWFGQFRRLAMRYERRLDIPRAWHELAAGLICWNFVQRFC